MPQVLRKSKVWSPPPVGSKARENFPSWGFLKPEEKKYPFIVKKGGKWYVSCAGLLAAYRRALMNRDSTIAAKAVSKAKQYGCPWVKKDK